MKSLAFLAFVVMTAPAFAGGPPPAPAPELGGGMLGLMIASGVVYFIRRKRG